MPSGSSYPNYTDIPADAELIVFDANGSTVNIRFGDLAKSLGITGEYKGEFTPAQGYPTSSGLVVGDYYIANAPGTVAATQYLPGDIALWNGTFLKRRINFGFALEDEDVSFNDLRFAGHLYTDSEVDNGESGQSETIIWANGNYQKSNLDDACTYTFVDPEGPGRYILRLVMTGGPTPGSSVNWPAEVTWVSGSKPELNIGENASTILEFYYDGTTYFGTRFEGGSEEVDLSTITVNNRTLDYTLAATDAGLNKLVRVSHADDRVVTIPDFATVPIPVGSVIPISRSGAGGLTITADTGVTLNGSLTGSVSLDSQYEGVGLIHVAEDEWEIYGSERASPFGAIYATSPMTAVVAVAGTFVKVTGSTAQTSAPVDFTISATGRLTYTGSAPIRAEIEVSASMTSSTNNATAQMRLAKNGTTVANTEQKRKIGTGADVGNAGLVGDIDLVNGDYLELFATYTAATGTLTFENLVIRVQGTQV